MSLILNVDQMLKLCGEDAFSVVLNVEKKGQPGTKGSISFEVPLMIIKQEWRQYSNIQFPEDTVSIISMITATDIL